jgi:hypothetical protein
MMNPFSFEMLEISSMICDKTIHDKVNHTPITIETNLPERLGDEILLDIYFVFGNELIKAHFSNTFNEEGVCRTFNSIDAKLIFRNDSVDPKFLAQYQLKAREVEQKYWSIEKGYESNEIKSYPLRAFDIGKSGGFNFYVKIHESTLENMDTACRVNPLDVKIAVHHPAEVISSKNFFLVPTNKSVSFVVNPKITRTSESLSSFGPAV